MAFGDDAFGSSGAMGGARGGRGRGGGGGGNRNRKRKRPGRGGGGGGGKEPPLADDPFGLDMLPPTAPGGSGFSVPGFDYGTGNNPLDTGTGSAAFNDLENQRQGAWGMLNQAGVNKGSGNLAADAYLDERVDQLIDEYNGLSLTQTGGVENPLTFENFMYGLGGEAPSGPTSLVPALVPGGAAGPGGPGATDWRRDTFYPALNRRFANDWARQNENVRGYDSRQWRGAGQVIPF